MSSFRITMGMKMNSYRYNLMQSTGTLNSSMEKVQTHRKFNSYAESPADATNAWRVRRDFMDNDSFQRNNKDTYTRFQTAWLAMGSIKTHLEDAIGRTSILRGLNDPTGSAKAELGGILENTAETIIQGMNGAKYGEEFVFSGTDGAEAPFSWSESGDLLYRGINITPPDYTSGWKDFSGDWGDTLNEEGIPEGFTEDFLSQINEDGIPKFSDLKGAPPEDPDELAAYNKQEKWYEYFQNMRTLNQLADETQYADLGMGMKEITDDATGETKMVSSTVFNNAIPGISMLGYGVDEDGDPKNMVLLMKELGELLSTCDDEGKYPNEGDKEKAFRLLAKFDEASSLTLKGYTYTDVQGKFLQSNETTLSEQGDNLNDQIADLEQVDMADAISLFMWDYSCYSAGLKIGTQLLSESLLDYMR